MTEPPDRAAHLIREIKSESVIYWCGREQKTLKRVPGPPDDRRQLDAWRKGGRLVCDRCATAIEATEQ